MLASNVMKDRRVESGDGMATFLWVSGFIDDAVMERLLRALAWRCVRETMLLDGRATEFKEIPRYQKNIHQKRLKVEHLLTQFAWQVVQTLGVGGTTRVWDAR
jgi:hypothetical protein